MKLSSKVQSISPPSAVTPSSLYLGRWKLKRCLLPGGMMMAAIALGYGQPALAMSPEQPLHLAQALPTPVPPNPAANLSSATSEQYIVVVNGNSDLLLQEVRQVEPSAFINFVEGSSVIQAGRFSFFENAQNRARELSALGIGAQVRSASGAIQTNSGVPADFSSVPVNTAGNPTSDLPPIPIAATPSSIEFGQASPFETTTPPPANTAVPPSAPSRNVVAQRPSVSGYYVVIPARQAELTNVANQVLSLGAPSSIVQTRMVPRGPHVAVGPYDDRGIAQEWTNYLRDAGLDARVHFE